MNRVNRRGYDSDSNEHYGKHGYGYASRSERGKRTKKVTDYVYRGSTGGWQPESPGSHIERYYYYGDKGSKGKSKGKSSSSKSKNKGKSKGSKGKGGYDDEDDYFYEDDDDDYEDDCTGTFELEFIQTQCSASNCFSPSHICAS